MNRWVLGVTLAATAFLCACATPAGQASGDPPEDKVYRTGSHIPAREPVGVNTNAASQDSIDTMVRNRAPVVPGGGR